MKDAAKSKVGQEWTSYTAMTYPNGIPSVEQHDQLQMAFYAGAVSMKKLFFEAMEGSEKSSVAQPRDA